MGDEQFEPTLVFDSLDIDLIVKVLAHTAFSPFFIILIPLFYYFHGHKITDPPIVVPLIYFAFIASFWLAKWCSRLWRNQGSWLYGPKQVDWGSQIVLITGGSSGVGELLANTLAVRNVTAVVLDVNEIQTENFNIVYYKCDVSKWEEVEAVSKKVIEEVGHPTVIVNNAGVVQGKLILDLTPEDVQQTFAVNTLAHFWTLKAFLPAMIQANSGHIVTVASILGVLGCAQLTDYCASKAALVSLNQSLRYELDKRHNAPGVRTTIILPGHINTPLFSTARFLDSWWRRFFLPSLAPVAVVKAIIAALDEQHSREIFMPVLTQFSPYIQLLPSYSRDWFQWITDADYVMKNFVKVSGRRADEGPGPDSFYLVGKGKEE